MWREYEAGTNEIVDESKENADAESEGIMIHADISNVFYNDRNIRKSFCFNFKL